MAKIAIINSISCGKLSFPSSVALLVLTIKAITSGYSLTDSFTIMSTIVSPFAAFLFFQGFCWPTKIFMNKAGVR